MSNLENSIKFNIHDKTIVEINEDGKLFWNGREVETDDEFCSAMMDIRYVLLTMKADQSRLAWKEEQPEQQEQELPKPGQLWQHKNGGVYKIVMLANSASERWDEYPPSVVYRRLHDQTVWSRPLSRWHGSFVQVFRKDIGAEVAK